MSWCSLAVCLPACFPEYRPGGMPALSSVGILFCSCHLQVISPAVFSLR